MVKKQTIWDGAQDGSYYRIPCVCVTEKDTLLVAFEHRYDESSDWARMDIELFRSTDGGASFAAPLVLAAGRDTGRTANNPVLIAGKDGIVHLLYCEEYGLPGGGVFYRKSTDDGVTWSAARNITSSTAPAMRNVFATGPCHGLCLADGTLLVPAWLVPKAAGEEEHSHHPAQVHLLMSRDGGEHWILTEKIPQGIVYDPNETCAALLPDGRVLLNIRTPQPGGCRSIAIFDPQTGSFSTMRPHPELPDPTCCGGMTTLADGRVLFVNCANPLLRANLTVKVSADAGESWQAYCTLTQGDAGYADMDIDSHGTLYIVHERAGCQKAELAVLSTL